MHACMHAYLPVHKYTYTDTHHRHTFTNAGIKYAFPTQAKALPLNDRPTVTFKTAA